MRVYRDEARDLVVAEPERSAARAEAGMWIDSPLLTFVDELNRETLTVDQLRAARTAMSRYTIEPTYIGGRSFYGPALDLERDRAAFLRILIRGLS